MTSYYSTLCTMCDGPIIYGESEVTVMGKILHMDYRKCREFIRAEERNDIEESFKRGGGNAWQANLYSMAYQRGCADERERNVAQRLMLAGIEQSAADVRREALTALRAKVMGLRDRGLGTVLRSDVLALFSESSVNEEVQ